MSAPDWTAAPVSAADEASVRRLVESVGWHDSVVYAITCVREGSADAVEVLGRFLTNHAAQRSARARVTFRRCWRVDMHLDWGVRCMSDGEMLYDLALSTAHEAIDGVRREWPRRPLPALFHARLDLATTGSWVDVVFSELAVEPLGPEGEHTAPPPVPIRGG